jgi:hypothetical protein
VTEDRVTYNEPGDWLGADYALGLVDEIVLSDTTVHFEMSTEASGYLHMWNDRRQVFARVTARPTTREERRQILARSNDRLRDHLRSVVPALHRKNLITIWAVPLWKRPASAVSSWWDARRYASVALCVDIEIDQHGGGPEAAP